MWSCRSCSRARSGNCQLCQALCQALCQLYQLCEALKAAFCCSRVYLYQDFLLTPTMLAAYFDIKPIKPANDPVHPVNDPVHPVKSSKTSKPKVSKAAGGPVEAYDDHTTHASFRPSKQTPQPPAPDDEHEHGSDEEDALGGGDGDEYEYLMREALETHDADEDTDITDFEDDALAVESTSSLASSPDSHPEFLRRRTTQHSRRGPSEMPVYAGPELWMDDEYSDFSDGFSDGRGDGCGDGFGDGCGDGAAFSDDEKNERQEQ